MNKTYAIVLAAGSGKRMGGEIEKQYQLLGGKPVLYYSLYAFEQSEVDEIILVTSKERMDYVRSEIVEYYDIHKVSRIVCGGAERYESVYNALKQIDGDGIVLIHDGARPFITTEVIKRIIDKAEETGACIPAVPVKDTIKCVLNDVVESTPDRSKLYAAQTPQGFSVSMLKEAYQKYLAIAKSEANWFFATDDSMLAEKMMDKQIAVVEGDSRNIKLTEPEDRLFAEWLLQDRSNKIG